MENSSSSSFTDLVTYSFTDLVNYSIPTSDPQNPNTQHGLQTHFPMIFYPTSLLPGSFHSNTIHKTSIHLESNQVTSFQLQATTMACLSMAIFYGGDTAGSSSSPVSSTCMFLVGGSRGEDSASPVTSPLAPAENRNKDPSKIEERSDVGSDEEKKGGR
jgi:hypothetical protein